MFILPLMTGHLFWKATILGGLYRGVPLYYNAGGLELTDTSSNFNLLCAKFFRGNKNIYLHVMSFLLTDMTHIVEIFPQVRQGPTYSK